MTTVPGAKAALVFPGKPPRLKPTLPIKPAAGVTVTVYVAVSLGMMIREGGSPLTTKSGEPLPLAIRARNASLGPPPNAGCTASRMRKSGELVLPVIQASPDGLTAMPSPASSLAPPT